MTKITVVSNIKARTFIQELGLAPRGPVQKMLVSECYRHMQKYTPFQSGTLAHGPQNEVLEDGILYNTPYAQYQYFGQLMLAPNGSSWARFGETKHLAGKPLHYHGTPMRGSHWDVRMWADDRQKILGEIAKKLGGKVV